MDLQTICEEIRPKLTRKEYSILLSAISNAQEEAVQEALRATDAMTTNQADETIRICIAAMDTVRGELQHLDHPVWRGTGHSELLSKLQFSAINLLAASVMCNVEEQEPEEVPFSKLYGNKQKKERGSDGPT